MKKREEQEKKKKKEKDLRKKKESAAQICTRPIRKAAARSTPVPEPPKKKLCAVQIASRFPIKPTAPKEQTPDPQSPEEEPAPPLPLCKAWKDSSYVISLPEILLDYVNTTLNVDSDGNCGF